MMKKKDIGRLAASAVICAAGAVTGLVMMVLSGRKIDEKTKKKEDDGDADYDDERG